MQPLVKPLLVAVALGLALPVSALAAPQAHPQNECRPNTDIAQRHGFLQLVADSLAKVQLEPQQAKILGAVENQAREDQQVAAQASEGLLLALAAQLPSGHVELRPLERELATFVAAEEALSQTLRTALVQVHAALKPVQRAMFAKALEENIANRAALYDSPGWLDAWSGQLKLSEDQKQKLRGVFQAQAPSLSAERQQFDRAMESFGTNEFAISRMIPKKQDAILALATALRAVQTTNKIASILTPEQRALAATMLRDRICHPPQGHVGYGYAFPYSGGFGAMR